MRVAQSIVNLLNNNILMFCNSLNKIENINKYILYIFINIIWTKHKNLLQKPKNLLFRR